ncbi:MAG TPA: ankyrin repeat domain-containing protein, partial [Thermoanaerobaculia bacterium]|nr:ankyrin repeat domain-containing protein [Thermoanaerobaculia bacterium]
GRVGEWTGLPPSVALGRGDQVAGGSKVRNEADFGTRVWLAFGEEGLVVAGEVRDDAVLWPAGPGDLLASDHVEVWLAFPGVGMPDLGFGSQWGWTDLPGLKACAEADFISEDTVLEECEQWVGWQLERRRVLPRLFVRQFLIAPDQVTEAFWHEALSILGEDDVPPETKACCAGAVSRFQPAAGGYTFEALLPPGLWPATRQMPIQEVRLQIDFVDNDAGHEKQETFLSSSRERKFGRPETLNRARLAAPLAVESDPPLAASLLAGPGSRFVVPGRTVTRLYSLKNFSVGYQRQPEVPSPALLQADLPREPAAQWGDVAVYLTLADWSDLSGEPTYRLLSFRGRELRGSVPLAGECFETYLLAEPEARATDGTRGFFFVCHGSRHPLGSGMAGAAEELDVSAATLHQDGRLALLGEEHLDSNVGRAGLAVEEAADGSGVVLLRTEQDFLADVEYSACSRQTLRWADLLSRDKNTALRNAVEAGALDEVRSLLDGGANPDGTDPESFSPLAMAVAIRRYPEMVQALLDHGADPNARQPACGGDGGWTALHLAAGLDDAEVVTMLLKAGARADAKNDAGVTVYDVAGETVRPLLPPRAP